MIAERISLRAGLWLLPLLLLVGMGSVLQWSASEARGAGDLRFYAAVQTYSALVLLLALVFLKRYTRTSDLAVVVGFYALAKALESLDKPIFAVGHIVSGHTLKHLAAAAAVTGSCECYKSASRSWLQLQTAVRPDESNLNESDRRCSFHVLAIVGFILDAKRLLHLVVLPALLRNQCIRLREALRRLRMRAEIPFQALNREFREFFLGALCMNDEFLVQFGKFLK